MSNDAHDERGRFTTKGGGAATGDHQASQSKPVGPGRQPVRLDTAGSPRRKTGYQGSSREETIANRMRVDERHMPTRSNADVAAMTDQSKAMGSITATPGRFDARNMKLDPNNNDHVNAVLRRNAKATPNIQPSAGQLIGAGIIKGN